MAAAGLEHRSVMTTSLEHGCGEATAAAAAGEIPVVMSGDGLIGQIGGVLAGGGVPLGIIPGGRGNDLARVLGISDEAEAAVGVLAAGVTREIDVGEVNGKRFLCIASCGFDSDANRIANEARLIKGNLVYAYAALRALLAWKPARFTLTLDGERSEFTGYSVIVANSRAYGGGMFIAPDAELDDGKFDVVTTVAYRQDPLPHQPAEGLQGRARGQRGGDDHARGRGAGRGRSPVRDLRRRRPPGRPAGDVPGAAARAQRDRSGMSARGGVFRAKVALARATGALSRRSGRGGGTTLPGRLLLRIAPDAVARLGGELIDGSTIISATNGKTTTAGMLAAAMRAAGRDPVHNRAGSNMSWGVATALLEQRGREGLFEVDEAWLPQMTAALDPGLIVLGNLFRDQLDRYGELEHLADEWAAMVAERGRALRLRPQRRRPAGRRPRPRSRAPASPGRHLLRDRGRLAGAARAPARPRRQALPPLRASVHLRPRLRRPSRPLRMPELRRRPTDARDRGDGDRAPRHARLAVADLDPRGRGTARAAPARPLQRLQRARRDHRGAAARNRPRADRERAGRGRGGVRAGGDDPDRRQGCLDPADQEPGRRERGPAHPAPRSGRATASTSGSRSTTRSPTGATSRGSGTPISSSSPAPRGGSSALEPEPRRSRCGSSTPGSSPGSSWSSPRSSARFDRALAEADEALFALPTYTALIELRKLLERARAGQGVLAMNEHLLDSQVIWHDVECGAYARRPGDLAPARDRGRRPAARARCRDRPGGAAPRLARVRRRRPRQRARARRRAREARGGRRDRDRDGLRRRPRARARAHVRRDHRPDAAHPPARRRGRARRRPRGGAGASPSRRDSWPRRCSPTTP